MIRRALVVLTIELGPLLGNFVLRSIMCMMLLLMTFLAVVARTVVGILLSLEANVRIALGVEGKGDEDVANDGSDDADYGGPARVTRLCAKQVNVGVATRGRADDSKAIFNDGWEAHDVQ